MKKSFAILVLVCASAFATSAQEHVSPIRHFGRLVVKHRELIQNTALGLAFNAQIASDVYCQKKLYWCWYTPSLAAGPWAKPGHIIWANEAALGGVIAANLLWHKYYPDNYLDSFWTAPLIAVEGATVRENFNYNNYAIPQPRFRRESVGH